MARIPCRGCKKMVDMGASRCPYCKTDLKGSGGWIKWVAGLFAVVAAAGMMTGNDQPVAERSTVASEVAPNSEPSGPKWEYSESSDKMGRGVIKKAQIQSLNTVSFGFPYQGAQRATLLLRDHPKYGNEVLFYIDRGQFMCGVDDCYVTIKFDDGKPLRVSASEPSDNDSSIVFINYRFFETKTVAAKRLKIEATFFQEGTRVFEFDVSGLEWSIPLSDRLP